MSGPSLILSLNCGSSSIKFCLFQPTGSDTSRFRVVAKGSANNVGSPKDEVKLDVKVVDGIGGEVIDGRQNKISLSLPPVDAHNSLVPAIIEHLAKVIFPQRENPADTLLPLISLTTHRIVHGGVAALSKLPPPHGGVLNVVRTGLETPTKKDSENCKNNEVEDDGLGEIEGLKQMQRLSAFAPLHNHLAVLTVRETLSSLPTMVPALLLFDSTFHSTIPPERYSYPVSGAFMNTPGPGPLEEGEEYQDDGSEVPLRKFGFHGLSYSYIVRAISQYLHKPTDDLDLIVCHLGSGASACAIKGGKSIDTTMGLTPLEGLPGGTRSGTIDPSMMFHLFDPPQKASSVVEWQGESLTYAEYVLNRQSGLRSLAGTNDFAEITRRMDMDIPSSATEKGQFEKESASQKRKAKLAFELFADRIMSFVGSYYIKLHGSLTALVFSGGIGENSARLRRYIVDELSPSLNIHINEEENNRDWKDGELVRQISQPGDGKLVLIVKTNEEEEAARIGREWWELKNMTNN